MANIKENQQFEEPEEKNKPYPGHKAYNLYTDKWVTIEEGCYNIN
jgi:hypothetical protein